MPRKGENIYKRKDGRWEGRYRSGYDANGRAKYRSIYGKSYQEVKTKLGAMKAEPANFQPSGRLTVKELFEEWMMAIKCKIKTSTYANYRMKADKHILPAFGGLRYEQLTVSQLHSFIQTKINSGLSSKYVSDIVVVLKSMAKYISITHGFANPIANVMLPKVEKKELRLFSDTQQKQLCQYLMQHRSLTSLGILLSLYMGLRVGEVCALRWSDIDFRRKVLTIRRTAQRVCNSNKGTRLLIGSPKSRNSLREIPIPSFLIELFQTFRGNSENYVLSGSSKVIEPRTMQYRFKAILKKVDLPSINYHSLRHMFATNCIAAGFDVKTLSELLGHGAVETTLNRYVHSSMHRKTECMNLLRLVA